MVRRYALWLLSMLILASANAAAEQEGNDELPDAELIEFLGEWETTLGNWVDPLDLESISENTCGNTQEDCHE